MLLPGAGRQPCCPCGCGDCLPGSLPPRDCSQGQCLVCCWASPSRLQARYCTPPLLIAVLERGMTPALAQPAHESHSSYVLSFTLLNSGATAYCSADHCSLAEAIGLVKSLLERLLVPNGGALDQAPRVDARKARQLTGRVSAAQLCSVVMASTQTEVPMRSPAATISRTSAATPTDARDWWGRLQPELPVNCTSLKSGDGLSRHIAGIPHTACHTCCSHTCHEAA